MRWLDRLTAKRGRVGIEVMPDGMTLVAQGCHGADRALDVLEMVDFASVGQAKSEVLTQLVHKHRIEKRLCHLVLHHQDYQLLLVEAPEVPDEELRAALRWKIKDLISMPLEQAVFDYFSLPADANRAAKRMIYVVVAQLDRIRSLINMISDAGLTLDSIDIVEMAMRNLAMALVSEHSETRGVGIARISEGGGVVSLYRGGNLYLSRQFQLAYSGGLLDDLPVDSLALEIQRSLDYYERQMGLSPPAHLYIGGENVTADKLTVELGRSITVPIQWLNLAEHFPHDADIDHGILQLCQGALGGLLRGAKAA